jgi:hypothetical protein
MKTKLVALFAIVFLCGGCTNKNDFAKGKKQLEQHGLNELEKMKVEQNTRYPEYEAVAEKV